MCSCRKHRALKSRGNDVEVMRGWKPCLAELTADQWGVGLQRHGAGVGVEECTPGPHSVSCTLGPAFRGGRSGGLLL